MQFTENGTTKPSGVSLRPVRSDDLPVFFDFQLDEAANQMAAFTHADPSDKAAFQLHWQKALSCATCHIRTVIYNGRIAGSVGSYVDAAFRNPEVTYWIGRTYWGNGIATASLQLFLAEHSNRPIFGRCAADNIASKRVLEKCQFVKHGNDRSFANARGEEIDEIIMVRTDI